MLDFVREITGMFESKFKGKLLGWTSTSKAVPCRNSTLLPEPDPGTDSEGILDHAVKGTPAQAQRTGKEAALIAVFTHESGDLKFGFPHRAGIPPIAVGEPNATWVLLSFHRGKILMEHDTRLLRKSTWISLG